MAIHGPLGILAAVSIGAAGGGLGNAVGQQISYGDVDFRAVGAQMVFSGITAGASSFALSMTGLFPRTGNFRKDFINNLSFLSSPDTPFNQRGVGIIGLAITGFFSQYGFPNPNSIRIAKKILKIRLLNYTFKKRGKKMEFKTSKWLFYLLLPIIIVGQIFAIWFISNYKFEGPFIFDVIAILFLIGQILLFLIFYKFTNFKVIIDEEGIKKIRFKRQIYFIKWDDIEDIKLYNKNCPWIFFSKDNLDKVSIDRARLFKKTIFLIYNEEIGNAIFKYCKNGYVLKKYIHSLEKVK